MQKPKPTNGKSLYDFLTPQQYQVAIAESERISAKLARDPSQIITHAELQRRLAQKKRQPKTHESSRFPDYTIVESE